MTLVHNIIKLRYVREGYIANHPPHLISDEEMCDAFLSDSNMCFFYSNYPLIDSTLEAEYLTLVDAFKYHIAQFKASKDDTRNLPDWVYSYMLGNVISVNSNKLDIHDLLVMLNIDNLEDVFNARASASCYAVSSTWLRKIPVEQLDHRPPTLFGEPHVIKALRIQTANTVK